MENKKPVRRTPPKRRRNLKKKKNGMKFIEEYDDPGHGPTRVYAITREEWEENRRRNAQIQSA